MDLVANRTVNNETMNFLEKEVLAWITTGYTGILEILAVALKRPNRC